jgi:hypothetical protein
MSEVEYSFKKVGETWCVRIWNGPKNLDFEGVTVPVKTKSGVEKKTKLGKLVEANGMAQIYKIAAAEKQEDKKPLPGPDEVPAGRYAIPMDGDWILVKVWRKEDRVATYQVTSSREQGGSLDKYKMLPAIAEFGAGQAAQEYGWRTGHCGRCGDRLKVNLPRKLGIGEHCMKIVYDDKTRLEMVRKARKELRAAGLDPAAKYDSLELTA